MKLRHLNFRLLEVFIQVVEQHSISAAARRLHLTQPTVSSQIRRLEEIFGSPLLIQEGRKMVPTQAGTALYHAANESFQRMQAVGESISDLQSGLAGTIKIALVNTAQYVLPQVVARFNQHYPNVNVELRVGNRESTLERYVHNRDDIYVFSHPPTDPQAHSRAFMRNRLVLIGPPGHWASEHGSLDFAQLLNEPFLIREVGSATRMVFDSWLAGQGLQLSHRIQVESNEAIRLSVACGSGLAVLSEHIVAHGSDAVCQLDVKGFPLAGQWYLVSRKDSLKQALIERFSKVALTQ